jgi:hypothetical protein
MLTLSEIINILASINFAHYFKLPVPQMKGYIKVLTMSNFFSLLTIDDTANTVTQHAARERYVLITARCWSSPSTNAELKLGQNNQRNTVPIS